MKYDGFNFDSKNEALYYLLLKKKKTKGLIKAFDLQPRFLLQPKFKRNGENIRAINYIADFTIYHLDGSEEIVDVKGMATPQALVNRKLFLYKYPDKKLTWITRDETKSKKWATIDGEWAEYFDLLKRKKEARKNKLGAS